MKKTYHKTLAQEKKNLQKRLERKSYEDQTRPMFKGSNIVYEIDKRRRAIGYGGIGAMHTMVRKLKLDKAINEGIELLKVHVPYFESDHVLNIAYNVLSGGTCLEDIERLRQDETYMNGLEAERIPDPTTAGDFLRRFEEESILQLQETFNETRKKIWAKQEGSFLKEAILDVDGTIAETTGECKEGMALSYKGVWGYAPLIISLANTNEVLYVVNRSGNRPSFDGAAEWIDRAIEQVGGIFKKVWLRGDTDFSLTRHLDGWDKQVQFVLGYDAKKNLVQYVEKLPESAWEPMTRQARPPRRVKTEERQRPKNVKEQVIKEHEYKNIRLESEQVAEFEYRPTHCQKTYRMVVVRKNLSVERGERVLFDDVRYFFYITNDRSLSKQEIVRFANGRCNQENVIEQLKNGVNALRMPTDGFMSNWAYMVIAALAWNLKAWYGLMAAGQAIRRQIVGMEFKRFLHSFVQIPCQIVKTGRRLVYRILTYTRHLESFLATFELIKQFKFT